MPETPAVASSKGEFYVHSSASATSVNHSLLQAPQRHGPGLSLGHILSLLWSTNQMCVSPFQLVFVCLVVFTAVSWLPTSASTWAVCPWSSPLGTKTTIRLGLRPSTSLPLLLLLPRINARSAQSLPRSICPLVGQKGRGSRAARMAATATCRQFLAHRSMVRCVICSFISSAHSHSDLAFTRFALLKCPVLWILRSLSPPPLLLLRMLQSQVRVAMVRVRAFRFTCSCVCSHRCFALSLLQLRSLSLHSPPLATLVWVVRQAVVLLRWFPSRPPIQFVLAPLVALAVRSSQ